MSGRSRRSSAALLERPARRDPAPTRASRRRLETAAWISAAAAGLSLCALVAVLCTLRPAPAAPAPGHSVNAPVVAAPPQVMPLSAVLAVTGSLPPPASAEVTPLLTRIQDTESPLEARKQAIAELADFALEDSRVVPELLRLLDDRELALEAIRHLGRLDELIEPELIALLESPDTSQHAKTMGLRVISKLKPPPLAALPVVLSLLDDPDCHVRYFALAALHGLPSRCGEAPLALCQLPEFAAAVPRVLRFLDDPDRWTRHVAFQASWRHAPEAIERVLTTGDVEARCEALLDLSMSWGRYPHARAVLSTVVAGLDDPDSEVRFLTLRALCFLQAEARELAPRFLECAHTDPDPEVRQEAAEAASFAMVNAYNAGNLGWLMPLELFWRELVALLAFWIAVVGLGRFVPRELPTREHRWGVVAVVTAVPVVALLVFAYQAHDYLTEEVFVWFEPQIPGLLISARYAALGSCCVVAFLAALWASQRPQH